MMAWSRSAMARSGFGISAIFASTSLSPSAFFARGPRRASAFSSWARSFIAARSSSVNPLTALPVTVALLADFCVSVFGLIEPPHTDFGWTPRRNAKCGSVLFKPSGTCVESYHRVLPNGSRLSCSGRRGAPPPVRSTAVTLGTGSPHHEHRAGPIGHGPVAELAKVVRSPAVGCARRRHSTGVDLAGADNSESQSASDTHRG